MKRSLVLVYCLSSLAIADNSTPVDLTKVEIEEKVDYLEIADRDGFVGDTIGKKSIDTLLGAAQTGSYKAFDTLPSVNQQSDDAYGLSLGKTMRIRGSYSGDDFLRNIEGLPVSSHGGGGDFIDFENVSSIDGYRGAIQIKENVGVRNLTGGMNLNILWPKKSMGGQVRQALGTDNMTRTFVRFDSGDLPTGTNMFLSYSTSGADKWRGAGEAPGKRENVELGISQKINDNLDVKLLAIYHDLEQHDYKSLSYAQTQELSKNYDLDYNTDLTGDSTQDGNYYDYSRQSYTDKMILSEIKYSINDSSSISLKPYYWEDTGYRYIGSGSSVTYLSISPVQYGVTASYDVDLKNGFEVSTGYWYQGLDDSLPPPLAMKKYSLNNDGSLQFSNWTMLGKIGTRNYQAPYANLAYSADKWNLKAGFRYLIQKDPSVSFYDTSSIPEVSYDDAFSYSSGIDHDKDIYSKTWKHFLPSLSAEYDLAQTTSIFASYSRGYGYTAWAGQIMSYSFKKSKLDAANISFQDLWEGLKPEEMDNLDLGFTHASSIAKTRVNFYYSKHKNKTVTVYDQIADVSYLKSDADATSYGAEVTLSADLFDDSLNLYTALSYNIHEFDNNVLTALNNITKSKGKQVPDSPKEMIKIGANYTIGDFSVHPLIKYIGKRYGDIENTENIDSYVLVDLQASYKIPKFAFIKDASFSLNCYNLTDKEYISKISTSDYQLSGTGYYQGAPLSIAAALDVKF